ncbi:MAG: hypothetical protein NZ853_00165 [Leptospiraceae bacterium]|nr:hypothetical protein [Leptospiraceae bacterium]MDW7976357.1 hypothetical protein [Leptospiraceae bacterium]
MALLLNYPFSHLNEENALKIAHDILEFYESQGLAVAPVGIYFENLESIHQEVFSFLKVFCEVFQIQLVFFHLPADLRLNFHLEGFPIRFGCGMIGE